MQAQRVFSASAEPDEVEAILEDLANVTTVEDEETPSQFPSDLQTINNIMNMSVDYLLLDLTTNPGSPANLSTVSACMLINATVGLLDQDNSQIIGRG